MLESANPQSWGNYGSFLDTTGHTLTIASDGALQALGNNGGGRSATGNFVNQGLINSTAAPFTMRVHYDSAGGIVTGDHEFLDSVITESAPPPSPTTLILRRNNNTLVSDNLANTTLWVQGHGFVADAVLNLGADVTNHGTILQQSVAPQWWGNYASNVATNGHTLTNAANGTLEVIGDGGGGLAFMAPSSTTELLTLASPTLLQRVVGRCQFATTGRHGERRRHAPDSNVAVTIDGGTGLPPNWLWSRTGSLSIRPRRSAAR